MDDLDLPPIPQSAIIAAQTPPRPRQSLLLARKRTRAEVYDDEPTLTTSSDPALFSSDEQAPGAENYTDRRRKKRTFKGSWWDRHPAREGLRKSARQKREFTRNFDSGIFMGSQDESGEDHDLLSSDSFTLEDELMRDQSREHERGHHMTRQQRPFRLWAQESSPDQRHRAEGRVRTTTDSISPKTKILPKVKPLEPMSEAHREVCEIVHQCLDMGKEDVDLSGRSLDSLPEEITSLQTLAKQDEIVPGMLDTGTDLEPQLRVYLANNLFTTFPAPILELKNLRLLSLRNNCLTSIPPGIRDLVNLTTLNIAGNQLNELPWEIVGLARSHKLTRLIAAGNPWRQQRPLTLGQENTSDGLSNMLSQPVGERGRKSAAPSGGVPSLSETVLRQLARLDPKQKIDFRGLMPNGTSDMVLDKLDLLKTQPNRQCGYCGRLMVMAASENLEWVALWPGSPVLPFRRLECADGCEKNSRSGPEGKSDSTMEPIEVD
ncbi:hypothetical protein PV08_05305 [Exophiala spinifera]|uniref:Uncharacterized protein n=1 Tax=Exophiala spinifera TaxID=91928 RepID=A0A0D2B9C4_9EURO|nr:uncharacterized protein PV08_05305 [Exophiala spinifera]KIW15260.1 hypothetical protein PV08_05305 [Exophiala spinifera]